MKEEGEEDNDDDKEEKKKEEEEDDDDQLIQTFPTFHKHLTALLHFTSSDCGSGGCSGGDDGSDWLSSLM